MWLSTLSTLKGGQGGVEVLSVFMAVSLNLRTVIHAYGMNASVFIKKF